jgi:hypothetical protein
MTARKPPRFTSSSECASFVRLPGVAPSLNRQHGHPTAQAQSPLEVVSFGPTVGPQHDLQRLLVYRS